jgi:hypothetical protein
LNEYNPEELKNIDDNFIENHKVKLSNSKKNTMKSIDEIIKEINEYMATLKAWPHQFIDEKI